MPSSLAREFYDRIVKAGDKAAVIAAIKGLVNPSDPTFEGDWLDFKTEPEGNAKQRDKKYRETWSETLGAFANVGGGVLIWGLDARKIKLDGREINAASDVKPVTAPNAVKSLLVENLRDATDPPLAGVEVEAYEFDDQPGTGFVVCYIPEGQVKPYRSEHADHNYYIRVGDSTRVMARPLLQAMFYPRSEARFYLEAHLTTDYVEGPTFNPTLRLFISNRGTATAREILLRIGPGLYGLSFVGQPPQPSWRTHGQYVEGLVPLHPGFPAVDVLKWSCLIREVPPDKDPTLPVWVYAANQQPQQVSLAFKLATLKAEGQTKAAMSADFIVPTDGCSDIA